MVQFLPIFLFQVLPPQKFLAMIQVLPLPRLQTATSDRFCNPNWKMSTSSKKFSFSPGDFFHNKWQKFPKYSVVKKVKNLHFLRIFSLKAAIFQQKNLHLRHYYLFFTLVPLCCLTNFLKMSKVFHFFSSKFNIFSPKIVFFLAFSA